MKSALIGAVVVAASAFVNPALAEAVIGDPGYRAQFDTNANGQNLGSRNPYSDGGYYRDAKGNAVVLHHGGETDRYRYHGGPKLND